MANSLLKDLDFLRGEICKYAKQSYDHGLIRGSGGNLSIRIPGKETVLVTPTDISLGDVKPEGIILVNLDGEIIESPIGLKPSKETSFHLRVYRLCPAVQAVVHLHPPYATAYANKRMSLPMVTVSARAKLKHVPTVECAPPGSDELCDVLSHGIESFPEARAFLMREHGILTMAEDLRTAYYLADLVEETAQIAFIEDKIRV
jgi:ribulose-5-phosphate 4-epimerase/fuculose-1-phosphate aldolase